MRIFPVSNGVPRFVVQPSEGTSQVQSSFDFKWRLYHQNATPLPLWESFVEGSATSIFFPAGRGRKNASQKYANYLVNLVKLPKEWFNGKLILDAGCGTGWASLAASRLKAKVVSVDLASSSVELTASLLKDEPNCFVFQGDIYQMPLMDQKFDAAMSFGVLHHTPSTRKAIESVARLVKPNGLLLLHLYEKTNLLRLILTNALRWIIQRYPESAQYDIIEKYLVKNPARIKSKITRRLYFLATFLIMLPLDPVTGFDTYSPRYNNVQSAHEVLEWLREAGFYENHILNEKRNTRFLQRVLSGDFGGSIYTKSLKCRYTN